MTDSTDSTEGPPDSCDPQDARDATAPTSGLSGSAEWPSEGTMADVGDLVYTLDATGHLTGVNGALLDATGYAREEVLGEHVSRILDEADVAAGNALIETLLADSDRDHATFCLDLLAHDGTRIRCEDHVTLLSTDDGEFRGTIGVLRDLTDRASREEALEALHEASRSMMTAATRQEVCEIAARASKRVLGYPITVVRLLADDGHTLVPTAMTAETRDRVGERPAYSMYDTPAGRAFEAGESRVYDDIHDTDDDYEKGNARAAMYTPLGDHGVISIADTRSGTFDRADVGLANVLAANAEAALDRVAHEGRVTALHDATRRMMSVETFGEVCEIAIETADDAFGLSISGTWLLDDAGNALRPAACTDEDKGLGDPPTFTADDSLVWGAFAAGETRVYDYSETTSELYDPDAELRHGITAPLGDYGILNVASTATEPFSESDVGFAELLAANAEAALGRADREAELRRREAELRRQNERLEEFASVVSHDIRNPLNVILGNLELARETGNLDHLEPIERAADRVNRLTTDLLTLARHGGTVGEVEKLCLASLVADAWAVVGCESARLTVNERLSAAPTAWGKIGGDPVRVGQLLENLLANAIEHGGRGVEIEVGPLSDAEGFYIADDGSGIPPTKRERVFDHDYTTSPNGIGLGLAIVETVADAHGWRVTVTESEHGGARFDVRTG